MLPKWSASWWPWWVLFWPVSILCHVRWWHHQMETFSALPGPLGIRWSPVNSPHKGQWRRALMFSLTCAWTNGWVNNSDASDLNRHHAHYGVTVMIYHHDIVATMKCDSINIRSTPIFCYSNLGLYYTRKYYRSCKPDNDWSEFNVMFHF